MKLKSTIKSFLPLMAVGTIVAQSACVKKSSEVDAEVMWAVSGSSGVEVEAALRTQIAFRLNLKTNRATMYKNGLAVDQWNIATADVSGDWHNGQPQYTPTGVFNVEDMQMCPSWYPRQPVNPKTGRVVGSEQERQQVFAQNPQIYGPCGSRNPLGRYVLWFNGAYGMHGNSNEEILEFMNPNDRRVSGGCVRNPNAKIRSVFHTVLDSFESLGGFASQVDSMEGRSLDDRWTLTKGVSSLSMRVVVGNWSADPAVGSRIGGTPVQPTPAPTTKPEPTPTPVVVPTAKPPATPVAAPTSTPISNPSSGPLTFSGKMSCKISSVDPASGVAPVYLNQPGTVAENRVASFYRLDWPVTVYDKIAGTSYFKVSRGYLDEKYVSNCIGN
ncbi:MAG: L,D-transpeptidase catalytic domain [Pseudomonadota bacterium]|jgi:hypothetical protein